METIKGFLEVLAVTALLVVPPLWIVASIF